MTDGVPIFQRKRRNRLQFALATSLLLTGCDSFRGAPDAVVDRKQELNDLKPYLQGDVLKEFYSASDSDRQGMNQTAWRDSVIAARLEIADRNYQILKNHLSALTSGIDLGTDLAALGLSGAASVAAAGTAQALSAASTGVLGAGTAFNKDALYNKTLPAIFAQMDANRSTVLLAIRKSQQNDATKYPLSVALSDLNAFERAGTLDSAIQSMTANATNQADSNKKELDTLTGLTVLEKDVEARKELYSDDIQALVDKGDKTNLDNVAAALGAAPDPDPKAEAVHILIALDTKVNGPQAASAISDLCTTLKSISGQSC